MSSAAAATVDGDNVKCEDELERRGKGVRGHEQREAKERSCGAAEGNKNVGLVRIN